MSAQSRKDSAEWSVKVGEGGKAIFAERIGEVHLDGAKEKNRAGSKSPIVTWISSSLLCLVKILSAPTAFFSRLESVTASVLLRAMKLALFVSVVNLTLLLPLMRLRSAGNSFSFVVVDCVLSFGLWLLYAFLLHIISRLFGGSGSSLTTMATFLYLTAYTPFLLLLSMPIITALPAADSWFAIDVLTAAREHLDAKPLLLVAGSLLLGGCVYVTVITVIAIRLIHHLAIWRSVSVGLIFVSAISLLSQSLEVFLLNLVGRAFINQ